MIIRLLDESLAINVFYDAKDCNFADNVCISVVESCPDEERLFIADENNIYLTPEQAIKLGEALINAADKSKKAQVYKTRKS